MDGENKENVVVVDDQVEQVSTDTDVLSPAEMELAKRHNIDVSKAVEESYDDKKIIKKEVKSPDDKKKEDEKSSDIPVEELDSFEKLHDIYQSRPEAFYKLPKNIKQLYHSQKGLYKRMKDEEEKRKNVEDEAGLNKIQNSVAKIRLDRIKQRLSNPEGLTVEELQEILEEKREVENNKDKPLTVKDLEAIEEKKRKDSDDSRAKEEEIVAIRNARIKEIEVVGGSKVSDITGGKYDNFEAVVQLVTEMAKTKQRYAAQVSAAINSNMDIDEVVDVIVDIARLSPKWGTSEKSDEKSDKKIDKESVDKLVKNASKQATSASLTGGRGSREIHISEDMDLEEALRVWDKIPRETQRKILKRA